MTQPSRIVIGIGALLALARAGGAGAAPERPGALMNLYARARAAEARGDARAANADFAQLLARDPASGTVTQHAYRQALASGDTALALRAARLLERGAALPPDGRVLLVADAIRVRDWAAARAQVDRLQGERLFGFLVPYLRAWIALGSKSGGDPPTLIEAARTIRLAQPYLGEQRAMLLFALGRADEGVAALRSGVSSDIAAWPVRTRLIAADALGAAGARERALGLLDGGDAALAAMRGMLIAGRRLPAPMDGPAPGVASLLLHVAADLGRQQLAPPGLALARDATLLAPRDGGAWLLVADLLQSGRRHDQALAALGNVAPADPYATSAYALRVALLSDKGDQEGALADALKATQAPGAGPWARVGDVYLAMTRPKDAAAAYARAIDAARAAKAPAAEVWPLYLQQGDALDRSGDWTASKASLEQALALAPDQPLVLNQLGYSLIAHRDDVARGAMLVERASAMRPDDPAITDSLGWAHYLRGQVGAALPLLERASAAEPAEPTINEHLGDAYWAAGRTYEARYAWRAALLTAADADRSRLASKIDEGFTAATASP